MRLQVGSHAHPLAPRVAGCCHCAVRLTGLQHARQWQVYVTEIERLLQRRGHPKHQNVAVFGLHLAALEDGQTVRGRQLAVVGVVVKLSMFREHEAVNRDIAGFDPLAVVLNFRASIVRFYGVGM